MVRFLIRRPIAVSMTYLGLFILGLVGYRLMPVSLMPDIDVPVMAVQVAAPNMDARQLENSVVQLLRQQLIQVPNVTDVKSATQNGQASINLTLEFGADVNLVFVAVNEKVDRAMGYLPKDIERPTVVKAGATDIPVLYINVTAKPEYLGSCANNENVNEATFLELSKFVSGVIKNRLEQLPDVAMVDISGTVDSRISVIPDPEKMRSSNITAEQIENALLENNATIGNILVHEGVYQYSLQFENLLADISRIGSVYVKGGEKSVRLKDVAAIQTELVERTGLVVSGQKDAISLAIIKKSDARMESMQSEIGRLVHHFRNDYPAIEFEITRDQTKLLEYTIDNLGSTLIVGAILSFLIMLLFLREWRSPLLIGLSVPVSLVISLLFFYWFRLSINIISLSGLILGIGMMIDNSIIVIDNITQHIQRGHSPEDACVQATNEVVTPLLSSALTTCSVFVPLIFISGMVGALLFDQAMAVTIGLLSSFAVSITLIPVYFLVLNNRGTTKKSHEKFQLYIYLYEKVLIGIFRRPWTVFSAILLIAVSGIVVYYTLSKEKFPEIEQDEFFMYIDWNEKINVHENRARCLDLLAQISAHTAQTTVYAGTQQYVMDRQAAVSQREAKIYVKTNSSSELELATEKLVSFIKTYFPDALFEFLPAENMFEFVFGGKEPELEARIKPVSSESNLDFSQMNFIYRQIYAQEPHRLVSKISAEEYVELAINTHKLLVYNISFEKVIKTIQSLFGQYKLTEIKTGKGLVPVMLGTGKSAINVLLQNATVQNQRGVDIPLRELLDVRKIEDFKTIAAGKTGEYLPLEFASVDNPMLFMNRITQNVKQSGDFEVEWAGAWFTNQKMVWEMTLILAIALLLLYFILAAQFESLSLPFIILVEAPIDILAALLFLKLFGLSINIMSLIGLIVMVGIVINDSILKIDTINRLRNQGILLTKAIFIGGKRRLKPILMTSLTTIFAMVPFLFISGMGSDIQKPLAVAVIGGMMVGTLVSIWFIPLLYFGLVRLGEKITRFFQKQNAVFKKN